MNLDKLAENSKHYMQGRRVVSLIGIPLAILLLFGRQSKTVVLFCILWLAVTIIFYIKNRA